jgi:hypothetical protein
MLGRSTSAVVAALGVAVMIVVLESPVVLRVPALTVLLLIPGVALARLLTGDSPGSLGDRAVRIPLSVLLGILLWLAVALLLNVLRIYLGAKSLAFGVGTTGLVLVIVTGIRAQRTPGSSTPGAVAARVAKAVRSGTAVATTAVVIVTAAYCATAMISWPVERYTTLGFVDSKPFAGEVPGVASGQAVRLNWMLRGVGCAPSPTLTSVRLTVDGNAVEDVAVDVTGDSSGTLTGAVTFTAPTTPGNHMVELAVLPAAEGGTPLPEPGYVSTFLEVDK